MVGREHDRERGEPVAPRDETPPPEAALQGLSWDDGPARPAADPGAAAGEADELFAAADDGDADAPTSAFGVEELPPFADGYDDDEGEGDDDDGDDDGEPAAADRGSAPAGDRAAAPTDDVLLELEPLAGPAQRPAVPDVPEFEDEPDPDAGLATLRRPRRTAAQHLGVAAEVAACFLGLVLLEFFGVDGAVGFVAVQPNPLWLPVLWAALRGGLLPALLAALGAALLHGTGLALRDGPTFAVLTSTAALWPLCVFLLVGYLAGQARDALQDTALRLRRSQERWRQDAERRRREGRVLHQINKELKRRIFDRAFDFQSLMATMSRTAMSRGEKAFDAPLGMLVDFCGATKCSVLYVLPDGTVDLAAHRGWREAEIKGRLEAASNNSRVQRAIRQARPMVGLGDEDLTPGNALLIAPLADASGVIRALLCIDEMPPGRFDDATVRAFLGIASWVATNLRRMQAVGASEDTRQSMEQALTASKSVGTPEQLSERIFLEDARRSRYNIDSVLVAVRILDVQTSEADYVASLEADLAVVLNASVRLTDDVYRFGFAGCYVLVLTGCESASADAVVERLATRFEAQPSAALGPVDLQSFVAGRDGPNLAALLPMITEHFFGAPIAGIDQRCPVPEPHPQRSGYGRDFVRRLRLELELARRFEMDLSLVDFRGQEGSVDTGPMVARHLWNTVGSLLRVTDGIYVLGANRCVVLLPCTSCLDGARIWARLDDALRQTLPEGRYEQVEAEFLALADADARDTMEHLIGPGEKFQEAVTELLSESELSELAFSPGELAQIQGGAAPGRDFAFEGDGPVGSVFDELAAEALAAKARGLEQEVDDFVADQGGGREVDARDRVCQVRVEADVDIDDAAWPSRDEVEQRLDQLFPAAVPLPADPPEPEQAAAAGDETADEAAAEPTADPAAARGALPSRDAVEARLEQLFADTGSSLPAAPDDAPPPAAAPAAEFGWEPEVGDEEVDVASDADVAQEPTPAAAVEPPRRRLLRQVARLQQLRDHLRRGGPPPQDGGGA